jgi:predicted RNase H-like HicB family nuclease
MTPHYSMVIDWSDEDNCFIVSSPTLDRSPRLTATVTKRL